MNVLKTWKQKISNILNKRNTQINQNFAQNIEYITNEKVENSITNTISNTSVYIDNSISTLNSNVANTYFKNTGGFVSGDISIRENITNRTSTPSSMQQNAIGFSDKETGLYICGLNAVCYDDGSIKNRMFLSSSLRSNNVGASIDIGVTNDGDIFTSTPHPTSSSNDHNIATTYWVCQKLNDYMINEANSTVRIKTSILYPSYSSVNIGQTLGFYDSTNNKLIGGMNCIGFLDGRYQNMLFVHNGLRNNNDICGVSVGVRTDGTVYATAPNPASNSNDNQIATTAFVNNVGGVVKSSFSGANSTYIVYSSGFCIQSGTLEHSTSFTVNLAKSFGNTKYIVQLTTRNGGNIVAVGTKSNTSFTASATSSGTCYWMAFGFVS